MLFKNKIVKAKEYPNGMDRHVYLDSKTASDLAIVHAVFRNETSKKISFNMLMKIGIVFLLESLEDLSEEEGIELLKEYYKKVWFN